MYNCWNVDYISISLKSTAIRGTLQEGSMVPATIATEISDARKTVFRVKLLRQGRAIEQV